MALIVALVIPIYPTRKKPNAFPVNDHNKDKLLICRNEGMVLIK